YDVQTVAWLQPVHGRRTLPWRAQDKTDVGACATMAEAVVRVCFVVFLWVFVVFVWRARFALKVRVLRWWVG
ncbi:hypothetical protein Pcac1_g28578, partial [Phytophthora cactorum]